jgi:aminopeptidase N
LPGQNLTRQEAQLRAELISVESYEIELKLDADSDTFLSKTKVRFSAKDGSESFIDASAANIHLIELNGETFPTSNFEDHRIFLPNLQQQNELVIEGSFEYTNSGEGLHKFVDPVDGETYLYSQFEVPDSRRVFAVFEQPDLKATFQFTISAPNHWSVTSNSPTPEPVELGHGFSKWVFSPTPKISSYITAIIAGPYVSETSSLMSSDGREIPLGVFCRKSLAEYLDADYIFEKTKQGFEFYEKLFDYPYPFEKYDQLFVPEFNAGAMENAGAVTFVESYVFRSKVTDATRERRVVTILHELAHMWFGDLVTMKWWNDLWLNESFAEYASTLATVEATEWTGGWTTFSSLEKNWAYRQDQLPSTHPIVAEINDLEDVQVNFDGITYAKGASVLKQLVAYVGKDQFFEGIANYFKKHQFGNTVLSDLLVELEKTSGRDLAEWSKAWLETAGVNTLTAEIQKDESGAIKSFELNQTATEDYPTLRPHRLGIGLYSGTDTVTRTKYYELDVMEPKTTVNQLSGVDHPGLILVNDEDLAYAKVRLDKDSREFAIRNLSNFEDPLARSVIWTSVWDSARDAEIPITEFIELVLNNIYAETESTTLLTLIRQLVTSITLYLPENQREKSSSEAAERFISLSEEVSSGSDLQFQLVKGAALLSTPAQAGWLKNVLTGEKSIAGLVIDQDLRWELMAALATLGEITLEELESELSKDNTANGQKAFALAKAALPDATNKALMWEEMVHQDTMSNAILESASRGFTRVSDPSVLLPYVDKYLESALEIWNSKSFSIAEYLLLNLYPIEIANRELREKTAKLLENPEIQSKAALRRILVEHLANLDRALACQNRMEK